MRIYFGGLGGVGLGPLALLCRDLGHEVLGSNDQPSRYSEQISQLGITVSLDQSGDALRDAHEDQTIDWYVHTSAMDQDNAEVQAARGLGIAHVAKRDKLINELIREHQLELIAVSGTHGKTTTTAMLVWLFRELKIPVAHLVGTNLPFAPAGGYQDGAKYLILEADEYDRTMLAFRPTLSLIPALDYDHPDTYPDPSDYKLAFKRFVEQSRHTIMWDETAKQLSFKASANIEILYAQYPINLPGHNKKNATLVAAGCEYLEIADKKALSNTLELFPGSERRFEQLAKNLYSDYAHHPVEIRSTLDMAREVAGTQKIIVVYQPHQNRRQVELADTYGDCFAEADELYWLPTYLSREDPGVPILSPKELVQRLSSETPVEISELDDALAQALKDHLAKDHMVLVLGAGSIDEWARGNLL